MRTCPFLLVLLTSVPLLAETFDFNAISAVRFDPPADFASAVPATNFTRRFTLPHSRGGLWRLSFSYALHHADGDRISGARAVLAFGPKKMPWGEDVRGPTLSDTGPNGVALYPYSYDVQVFPGTRYMDLSFAMWENGTARRRGDFRVAGVTFEEIPPDTRPVTLELPYADYLDNTFHIGSNQVGLVLFRWRCNAPKGFDWHPYGCRLNVPPGFTFVDASNADTGSVRVVTAEDGSSTVAWRLGSGAPARGRTGGSLFGVLLRANSASARGTLGLAAEIAGKTASEAVALDLVADAAVQAAHVPQHYGNGAYLGGDYAYFPTRAGNRAFAQTLAAAGVTWLIPDLDRVVANPELVPLWRACGMRRIVPDGSGWVANGFHFGEITVCPCVAYSSASPFRAQFRKRLAVALKGCDGMWSNWEPYSDTGRRRLCPRCTAAAAKLTPSDRTAWLAEEHGKVVKALAEDVAAATGSAVGFVPGIYWPEIGPGHGGFRFTREIRTEAYAGALAYLNAFGPYVRWNTGRRWIPEYAPALAYFCVAEEVMRQVEEDYEAVERPALMAFPLGMSGGGWASQPEWLEFALDAFFFNGWACALPWSFPAGGDARYLAAFVRATEQAGDAEDVVWNGARRNEGIRVTCKTPLEPRPWIDRSYLPALRNVTPLQWTAWEKGGARLVALFNADASTSAPCQVSFGARTLSCTVPPCSCRTVAFPRPATPVSRKRAPSPTPQR